MSDQGALCGVEGCISARMPHQTCCAYHEGMWRGIKTGAMVGILGTVAFVGWGAVILALVLR